jgi:hypothetical protein
MEKTSLVDQYLIGLQERLSENDKHSLSYAFGASVEQLITLKGRYPACPDSLLQLLARINGTYWQKYGDYEIAVLILGSDVFEYPYYLKSVEQILEENNNDKSIRQIYGAYIDNFPDLIGPGIDPDVNINRWLCFSDCMNNGGTSSLYLDFNPLSEGSYGQVVRYLHDPDSYKVIAQNFDEYLQMLMEEDYSFILPAEE